MALIHIDGFDHYGDVETKMTEGIYDQVDSVFSLSTTNPRTGLRSLRRDSTSTTGYISFSFDSTKKTIGFGFTFHIDQLPSSDISYELCYLSDTDNARQINFTLTSGGAIACHIGSAFGQFIGQTSDNVISGGAYNHIEFGIYASKSDESLAINNICFCLDVSNSMLSIVSGSTTRWDILQSEMVTTLTAMKGTTGAFIGIVAYGFGVESMFKEINADSDIDDLITYVNGLSPDTSGFDTRWDLGVEEAVDFFDFSNSPNPIIVFTSDGLPENGPEGDEKRQETTDAAITFRDSIAGVALYFIQIDLEDTTYSEQLDSDGDVQIIGSAQGEMSSTVYSILGFNSANPSKGICEIRVNGVTEISVSGVETVSTENEEYSNLYLSFGSESDHGVTTDIDDFFIWDDQGPWNNSFIGDRRCYLLKPNQDTNIADFEPSSGSFGYKMIDDESPDDDSTYIIAEAYLQSGSPLSGTSEFEIENLTKGSSLISGLNIISRAAKTDSTSAEIYTSINSNNDSISASAHTLTTSYRYYSDIYEYDPSTIASITKSGFDSLSVSITADDLDAGLVPSSPDIISPDVVSPGVGSPTDETTYEEEILLDNPVGYWRLGESSGTTANDSSGNGLNGTYNSVTLGTAGLISGDPDTSVTFSGSPSRVDIPDSALLDVTDLTLEAWIKTSTTGAVQHIVTRDRSATVIDRQFQFRLNSSGHLQGIIFSSGGTVEVNFTHAANIADGSKHHVGMSYNSTTFEAKLYLDGSNVETASGSNPIDNSIAHPLNIGVNQFDTGSYTQYYTGVIDEVAIYDSVLGDSRMLDHYNKGA